MNATEILTRDIQVQSKETLEKFTLYILSNLNFNPENYSAYILLDKEAAIALNAGLLAFMSTVASRNN